MFSPGQATSDPDGIVQRFDRVINGTHCPFACKSKVKFAPVWKTDLTTQENVMLLQPYLDVFVEHEEIDGLDMFVIEVREYGVISRIDLFARFLHEILDRLSKLDPTRTTCLTDGITSKEWDFKYRGLRFFIPTFAPFYANTHARYSHYEDTAFIAFQPDHCFDRHGITSNNPNRYKITQAIRDMFEKGGSGYDIQFITQSVKAARYIKSLRIGDSPVKWWETDIPF